MMALNPFPPPVVPVDSLSPTAELLATATALPARPPFVTPTPLLPLPLSPTPRPVMPFSATSVQGLEALPMVEDCQPLIAGTVTDAQGEPLTGYAIHVWGPGLETIVRSGSTLDYGPSGWEVEGMEGEGVWTVQLHRYDVRQVHPAVSDVVYVTLPEVCPQAAVHFQEIEK